MKRIILSGMAVAILTTGALAENKQLDNNWFESYKNSLLKIEKQGVPEIRELYGKDSSYAFGGELRVLAITEDEPIELQKERMKWFDSYSKQFFNSKEEVDATMVPLAVAGYDFNFNGMEFEDRSKADNYKKGFFSGFMFAYDVAYRIILNKNRTIENAHKFALNSIAELKYKKSPDLLSPEEINRIVTTDYEYKYLMEWYPVSEVASKIFVTIASVSLSDNNVTKEDFKRIGATSKCLVAFFDAQKKISKEQFTTLLTSFKTYFKNEKFTEDKGVSFIENYKF